MFQGQILSPQHIQSVRELHQLIDNKCAASSSKLQLEMNKKCQSDYHKILQSTLCSKTPISPQSSLSSNADAASGPHDVDAAITGSPVGSGGNSDNVVERMIQGEGDNADFEKHSAGLLVEQEVHHFVQNMDQSLQQTYDGILNGQCQTASKGS